MSDETPAMTSCTCALLPSGEAALAEIPPDVEAVLNEPEGSSSEDTSDEAYARMHKLMEDNEHRNYAALVAGARQSWCTAMPTWLHVAWRWLTAAQSTELCRADVQRASASGPTCRSPNPKPS